MNLSEVFFTDGPLHGKIMALRPEADGFPPIMVSGWGFINGEIVQVLYVRRVSPKDDGPLWEYLYVAPSE